MTFDINSFKANFSDRARGYLFYIMLNIPGGSMSTDQAKYLVKSGNVPEGTIEPVEIPWQGMMYKMGTTHTYGDWTVSFSIDKGYNLYKSFLSWQKMIHNPETNEHGNPTEYMQDQEIWLLDNSGVVMEKIKLVGAWPTTVGELALDYSSKETATFDVTFSYMYKTEA